MPDRTHKNVTTIEEAAREQRFAPALRAIDAFARRYEVRPDAILRDPVLWNALTVQAKGIDRRTLKEALEMAKDETGAAPTKKHVPAPGRSSGLRGEALCGKYASYGTGDHDLIRRLAVKAMMDGDTAHWCSRCLRKLNDETGDTGAPARIPDDLRSWVGRRYSFDDRGLSPAEPKAGQVYLTTADTAEGMQAVLVLEASGGKSSADPIVARVHWLTGRRAGSQDRLIGATFWRPTEKGARQQGLFSSSPKGQASLFGTPGGCSGCTGRSGGCAGCELPHIAQPIDPATAAKILHWHPSEQTGAKMKNPYANKYHRNGDVTVWNVYTQSWERYRAGEISDRLLATMGEKERKRIAKMAAETNGSKCGRKTSKGADATDWRVKLSRKTTDRAARLARIAADREGIQPGGLYGELERISRGDVYRDPRHGVTEKDVALYLDRIELVMSNDAEMRRWIEETGETKRGCKTAKGTGATRRRAKAGKTGGGSSRAAIRRAVEDATRGLPPGEYEVNFGGDDIPF